jgi:hypothetical protein
MALWSSLIRPSRFALHAALDREQPEAGLAALAEALSIVDTLEECWWEAELYRLKGASSSRPASTGMRPMW